MKTKPLPPGKTQHVFFLYRTEDTSRALMISLTNRLEAKGYICGTHESDFTIGDSYLGNLGKCIKGSHAIVPLISNEFLKSPYCMKDLEIACHFYHEGIAVMPLLYNIKFQQIPDILKQLVCLDVRNKDSLWIDKFMKSLNRHVCPSALPKITPNQEADDLLQKFNAMSAPGQILFAEKFSSDIISQTTYLTLISSERDSKTQLVIQEQEHSSSRQERVQEEKSILEQILTCALEALVHFLGLFSLLFLLSYLVI